MCVCGETRVVGHATDARRVAAGPWCDLYGGNTSALSKVDDGKSLTGRHTLLLSPSTVYVLLHQPAHVSHREGGLQVTAEGNRNPPHPDYASTGTSLVSRRLSDENSAVLNPARVCCQVSFGDTKEYKELHSICVKCEPNCSLNNNTLLEPCVMKLSFHHCNIKHLNYVMVHSYYSCQIAVTDSF